MEIKVETTMTTPVFNPDIQSKNTYHEDEGCAITYPVTSHTLLALLGTCVVYIILR